MSQVKAGQNLRWYFQGSAVGMGRMTSLKPDTSRGLDPVKEAGRDDVVEYVPKIKETTVAFGYNVINKKQLAMAMGQALSGTTNDVGVGAGEVPEIPENFDCVERRIKAGTANTGSYVNGNWVSAEVIEGFTLYQLVNWEKDSYDQEVDKIVARSLSAKCKRPINFEGIAGIQFDKFMGDGRRTAFTLTQSDTVQMSSGRRCIRVESPLMDYLEEGIDYVITYNATKDAPGANGAGPTGAGANVPVTSSGISPSGTAANGFYQQTASGDPVLNFTSLIPASSTVPNVLCVYAYGTPGSAPGGGGGFGINQ